MTRSAGADVGSLGRRTPPWRRLLVMLAVVLGLGLSMAAAPQATADDGDLEIELTAVTPAVVTTGDELVITGRVHNRTDAELAAPTVRLLLQVHVPSSTDALASWLDGSSDLNVSALTGWNAPEDAPPIPAGGSVPFTIEIETDGTFSQLSAWGPRGVEIQARTEGLTASARTTMLWFPTDPPVRTPAELALLVPLTPTAQEWADAVEQGVPVVEVAAPRLLRVLEAVGPYASLAIDPALLEQEPPGGAPASAAADETGEAGTATTPGTEDDEGTDPPGTEGAAREQLIERLTSSERRGDLIALGYADADVTALTGAGGAELWEDGVSRSEALLAEAGLTVENVAWPSGPLSSAATSTLIDGGAEAVVLDAADYTIAPNVHATASTGSRDLDAILGDEMLGDALASPSLTGVTGRQATLALSAVLTRAAPQDEGGFLVALPRDIGSHDLDNLSEQIDTLYDAPWFEPATLRSLLGRTGQGTMLDLPHEVATPGAISRDAVDRLLTSRTVVETYTAAAGPSIDEEFMPRLLTPLGAALAADPVLRGELVEVAVTTTRELGSKIRVEAGSDLLLIAGDASLPVTVTNDLDVPATVNVQLVPEENRLQPGEHEPVVLPPQQSTTVRIPITALANGNVRVDVHVHPITGERDLAEPASFIVRVRAEWENIGTAIVASLLAVAFIIGLIRTIRRGGRRAASQ